MAAPDSQELEPWLDWARSASDRDLLSSLAAAVEAVVPVEWLRQGRLAPLLQAVRERIGLPADVKAGTVPVSLRGFNPQAFHYYDQLGRLRAWVEQHLDEQITLRQAAQVAAFEATYFSKFFHQKVGLRFTEWLLWMRVQRAVGLLARRDVSITAAARRSGFYDVRTFQRAFKKFVGTTPSGYRGRMRGTAPLSLENGDPKS
jgi:AraC-like DNA-binding protein